MSTPPKSAYEVLGVSPTADADEVNWAYRQLALGHHPDAVPAAAKQLKAGVFAAIFRAHRILSDPERRKRYDDAVARGSGTEFQAEAGEAALPSLVDILRQIPPLGIACDLDELTADMDGRLRWMLIAQSAIHLEETILDLVGLTGIPLPGQLAPEGSFRQGWLVITDLGVWLALKYEREWQEGGTRRTQSYYYVKSFPYQSMKHLQLREASRVGRSYRLRIEDSHGIAHEVGLLQNRLTALFLAANSAGRPVEVVVGSSPFSEFLRAGAVAVLAFAALYLSLVAVHLSSTGPKSPISEGGEPRTWPAAVALSLPVALGVWLGLRVYRAWYLWQGDAILDRRPNAGPP